MTKAYSELDGDFCDIGGLPESWCDHCREREIHDRRAARLNAAHAYLHTELSGQCTARFFGACDGCGQPFQEGDWVGVTQDERYLCQECAQ